jgi:hypothetical protein
MKLSETIYSILLNEYSQGLIKKLLEKYKLEMPNLPNETIIKYIKDFEAISSKLDNKDILKYNWKQLETAVDSNRSVRIKAGKVDPTAEDANMLYKKDGIRLYHANSKRACIKYSNGYSFCIGARGDENMYHSYRKDGDETKVGTPYFVFNDNMSSDDPSHVLVIFVKSQVMGGVFNGKTVIEYTVTNANNDGDEEYDSVEDIVADYPFIKPLIGHLKPVPISDNETKFYAEKDALDSDISELSSSLYSSRIYPPVLTNMLDVMLYPQGHDFDITSEQFFNAVMTGTTEYKFSFYQGARKNFSAQFKALTGYDNYKCIMTHEISWLSRAFLCSSESESEKHLKEYHDKLLAKIKECYVSNFENDQKGEAAYAKLAGKISDLLYESIRKETVTDSWEDVTLALKQYPDFVEKLKHIISMQNRMRGLENKYNI